MINRNVVTGLFSKAAMTVMVIVFSLCAFGCQSKAARPNVVVIIGDDISVDDFGCYGNPNINVTGITRIPVTRPHNPLPKYNQLGGNSVNSRSL